jgi:class I fructose-bisphosphate aldolase
MFTDFGKIQEQAHKLKMAAIAWIYPRGSAVEDEASPEMTVYAARIGLELGADMIKIKYCGSEETFKKVIQIAGKTKVVLSGGEKIGEEEFSKIAETIIKAGTTGIAVGRNVFQHQDPLAITEKIKKIVFD